MAIQLEKKKPFDLTKHELGLKSLYAGLSWDRTEGYVCDLDISVFMLNANNKIPSDGFLVFYNNLASMDGSVRHSGDNRTGEGDGDDEFVSIELPAVNSDVVQMLIVATIDQAEERGEHFGIVRNACVRMANAIGNKNLCEFEVSQEFADADSLIMGRLFRDGAEWKFEAMGDAFSGGLGTLLPLYT